MVQGKLLVGHGAGFVVRARFSLVACRAPDCCNPVASRKVWSRIAAILSLPKVFGSGLPQSCHFPKSLAPDCRNLVASKSVWLRIAAILSLPKKFGSGLQQSCRFPKSLEQDCCNPVTSRKVWLRIAAILPFPVRNCPDFGKPKKKTAGNGRCFEKSLSFRLSARRVCQLRQHRRQSRRHRTLYTGSSRHAHRQGKRQMRAETA